MASFEEIAKQQATLEASFESLKKAFNEADAKIKVKRASILKVLEENQKQEALSLAQIGEALQRIIGE